MAILPISTRSPPRALKSYFCSYYSHYNSEFYQKRPIVSERAAKSAGERSSSLSVVGSCPGFPVKLTGTPEHVAACAALCAWLGLDIHAASFFAALLRTPSRTAHCMAARACYDVRTYAPRHTGCVCGHCGLIGSIEPTGLRGRVAGAPVRAPKQAFSEIAPTTVAQQPLSTGLDRPFSAPAALSSALPLLQGKPKGRNPIEQVQPACAARVLALQTERTTLSRPVRAWRTGLEGHTMTLVHTGRIEPPAAVCCMLCFYAACQGQRVSRSAEPFLCRRSETRTRRRLIRRCLSSTVRLLTIGYAIRHGTSAAVKKRCSTAVAVPKHKRH